MIIALRDFAGTTEHIANIWEHHARMGHGHTRIASTFKCEPEFIVVGFVSILLFMFVREGISRFICQLAIQYEI
jgi:hypothetical protein